MADDAGDLVTLTLDDVTLEGRLAVPPDATGLVAFAHGSGSSRLSPRNGYVAGVLRERGLGTLLFDLLTEDEDRSRETRFDVDLLTDRLVGATEWLRGREATRDLRLGYFGSSTGAAAALSAAARLGDDVDAVVSRGGRVDLAGDALADVRAPTLFVVGGATPAGLNRAARAELGAPSELAVVDGADGRFDSRDDLAALAERVTSWFDDHLG